MKCSNCGGDVAAGLERCAYCGSSVAANGKTDREQIFERVRQSDAYKQRDDAERHARLPRPTQLEKVFLVGFFAIFIAGSAVIGLMMFAASGVFALGAAGRPGLGVFALFPMLMAVVPLGFVVLGVLMARTVWQRIRRAETSPVEAFAACVLQKRTEIAGSGNRIRTHYFATFQHEDGRRIEYRVWDGRIYGRLIPEDAGVLYVRDQFALDFDHVTSAEG